MTGPVQVADLREQFKGREDLAEVVHVLHHGKHFTIYIATAKSTGLKVLLKAYDIGKLVIRKVHSFSPQLTHLLHGCQCASSFLTVLSRFRDLHCSIRSGHSVAIVHLSETRFQITLEPSCKASFANAPPASDESHKQQSACATGYTNLIVSGCRLSRPLPVDVVCKRQSA